MRQPRILAGGENVGYLDPGDSMTYGAVDILESGEYVLLLGLPVSMGAVAFS